MDALEFYNFTLPGCGRVVADLSRDDLPPIIQFEDGTHCFGLPRTTADSLPMGYESIAEANFIHEAIHLFIAHQCNFVGKSVLYRAGKGADFSLDEVLRDAMAEEKIVLGLQIAVNETEGDGHSTNKVDGFLLHIVGGAREYARVRLAEEYNLDLDNLVAEFRAVLATSGCLTRAFARKPEIIVSRKAGLDAGDLFGDLAEKL